MKPAFSVITAVYNGAQFVTRCYYTLKVQTFTDWEWVVVDDGSTDKTADLVRQIDDSRVRLIAYMPNKGRGYARKRALEVSRGDWMVVWDVDDMYFPDRLEKINDARLEGYDFCCSYAVVVDNNIRIKGIRGFHPASMGLPRHFVHHTLGCRMGIARQIGYDKMLRVGEDITITWILDEKYRGRFWDDALTIYQEDREVSLHKAIECNYAQFLQLQRIYHDRVLRMTKWQYLVLNARWRLKVLFLSIMRLAPRLYLWMVCMRTKGQTLPSYSLPPGRLEFIDHLRSQFIDARDVKVDHSIRYLE